MTGTKIFNSNGKLIKRSKNLRGILDYARVSPVNTVLCHENFDRSYTVEFTFDNDALGLTVFADWRVLCHWLKARRSWQVENFKGYHAFVKNMA